MRYIILIILISTSYAFGSEDFTVIWECVKSDSKTLIPAKQVIEIPIDLKNETIDTKTILNFIDNIVAEKKFDLSRCLNRFSSSLKDELEKRKDLNDKISNQLKKLSDTVYSTVTFYTRENYQKRVPIFLPMDNLADSIEKKDKEIILESLNNKCELSNDYAPTLFLSRNFLYEVLKPQLSKIKNENGDCFLKLKDNLLKLVTPYFQTPNECRKSKMCKKYQSAVAKYTQEIGIIFNDPSLIERKTVNVICNNNFQQFFNTLLTKTDELEAITNCVDLTIGEYRIIKKNQNSSSFKLKKIDDKTTHITLNFVFSNNNKENISKLESCFLENQNKLQDSLGNKLQFSFISDIDSKEIMAEKISIINEGRPNSLQWLDYTSMPCSTMIHETLHHLGLNDEYEEKSTGVRVDLQSKKIQNIEENTNFKLDFISEKKYVLTYNFNFEKSNTQTIDKINSCFKEFEVKLSDKNDNSYNFNFISDPKNTQTFSKKVAFQSSLAKMSCIDIIESVLQYANLDKSFIISYQNLKEYKIKKKFALINVEDKDFVNLYDCRVKSPKNSIMSNHDLAVQSNAIFYPAQIRMITNFGCTHKYRLYNLCAQEAYKTSLEKYGDSFRCNPALPKECKNGSSAWLK